MKNPRGWLEAKALADDKAWSRLTPAEQAAVGPDARLNLVGVRRERRDARLLGRAAVVEVDLAASDPEWLEALTVRAAENYRMDEELMRLIESGFWPGTATRNQMVGRWWSVDEEVFEPKGTNWVALPRNDAARA